MGYSGLYGGLHPYSGFYSGLYPFGLNPFLTLAKPAEEEPAVEAARKKRSADPEAEADPAVLLSTGLHTPYTLPLATGLPLHTPLTYPLTTYSSPLTYSTAYHPVSYTYPLGTSYGYHPLLST